jgi:hypothetical protein
MVSPLGATNVRPENSTLVYSLNLLSNKRAFWLLQIPATLGFFIFGFLFVWWTIWIRPNFLHTISTGVVVRLLDLLLFLIGFVVFILLHELVHGAFFWIYSRSRPRFGFRGGYAYAAAPGWFFPPRQYLVIALAPLVLLSILGMVLVVVVPAGALVAILFVMTANAAGAVGDMWIAFMVIRERRKIVIEDLGDGMNFYALG